MTFFDKAYFDFCAANDTQRLTSRVYGAVNIGGRVKITCTMATLLDTVIKARALQSMGRKAGLSLPEVGRIAQRVHWAEQQDMRVQSAKVPA
jgi:hypothetical protein